MEYDNTTVQDFSLINKIFFHFYAPIDTLPDYLEQREFLYEWKIRIQ